MDRFRDYVISEGAYWDAVKTGFETGFKAFKAKRKEQQEAGEKKAIRDKVLSVEGKDLEKLIARMVAKGYELKNGEIKDRPKEKTVRAWMLEGARNVQSQRWRDFKENRRIRSGGPLLSETRELVGNAQDLDHQPG